MKSKTWCSPGQPVVLMLAGWINRHQQAVIAYQREETKVRREMLGGKRLRFTDRHGADGPLVRRERLGGLLNCYYREAA